MKKLIFISLLTITLISCDFSTTSEVPAVDTIQVKTIDSVKVDTSKVAPVVVDTTKK